MRIKCLALLFCSIALVSACKNREEELAEKRSKGAELVENEAARVRGIGEALQSDGRRAAAELTTGVGEVVGGVTEGIDRAKEGSVIANDNAQALGLNSSRAILATSNASDKQTLKVYVSSARAFEGSLHVRAYDDKKQEIGRSGKVERKLDADDASYVSFEFDSATPMSRTARWVLFASRK